MLLGTVCGLYVVWAVYRRVSVRLRARALDLRAGGLYSVATKKGYQVVKVLVVETDAVHVRLYKQSFGARPRAIEPGTLSLGTIHDTDGFGMGHLPLSRAGFFQWKPELIAFSEVSESELEGYELYKESGGGELG